MRRYSRNPALRNMRTGGLLGIETKYLDCWSTGTALAADTANANGELNPTNVVTGCLSSPAQGDGAQNREGKKIVVKSCLIQGVIDVNPQATQATADTIPTVFFALVQDMQTNGVTPNSEDVFANPAAVADNCTQPFRNMSYTSRFKVLKTWHRALKPPFTMANDTGATGGLVVNGFNLPFTLSWKGQMPANFTTGSTTADVANCTDNSLHLMGWASNIDLSPTVRWSSRIRFVG